MVNLAVIELLKETIYYYYFITFTGLREAKCFMPKEASAKGFIPIR